ncbi:MAG: type II toxin-antitoxin system Phd/YefM family antitoxin [Neisseria sp.]|nr:type II toxin-antitoxin system Phd/YefM family antitoxin [Neisseria sp.]
MQANIHEAKTQLSYLAKCAAEGKKVIIAKAGVPYVQLTALDKPPRKPGALAAWAYADTEDFMGGDAEVAALFESSR